MYRAQEMVHVLGDGDNVHVAVRFAGGAELTAVVYIDHNMGTLVKDAFVVPESLADARGVHAGEGRRPRHRVARSRPGRRPGPHHRGDRAGGDDRPAVRDRHVAGVPPDRRVAHPADARRWGRLRAAGVERAGPAAAGRPVLRLAVRGAARRRRPPRAAGVGDLVRHRLRPRRSAALEPGGGRDHPGGLDPAQDRRRRRLPVEGPGPAAGVRPVLPRRTRHPGRADPRHARRRRPLRAGLPAHDPLAAAAGPDGAPGGDRRRRSRRSMGRWATSTPDAPFD